MNTIQDKTNNKKRILVVDDSKVQLRYAELSLGKSDYEVITTDNIWISKLVKLFKPHLILMDVEVNEFYGTDTVKSLKLTNMGKNILIYLHSAKEEKELKELSAKSLADGYICKTHTCHENSLTDIVDDIFMQDNEPLRKTS